MTIQEIIESKINLQDDIACSINVNPLVDLVNALFITGIFAANFSY